MNAKKDTRPIICGTDFSTTAREAVEIAAALAKRLETKLILVHVEEFHGLAEMDPTLFEAALSQKKAELDQELERLRKDGVDVEEKLFSGSAFDELVSAAAEANGRLLILGAVGHGLPRRLLVGSVAERAAETSPVPTLVVRPGSRLGSWIRGEHPLKVLVGYDFSSAGDAALRWLSEIQNVGTCAINVVHIDWPPDEAHRVEYNGPLALTENPEKLQNLLERDLAERVEMCLPRKNVTITVEAGWGHPEGYLFELASREHVDLLVVGTHHRHGLGRLRFGSVSRTVLHHAKVPVAVVPPAEIQSRATMPKLDRVLAATDFSEQGNKAVSYACAILNKGGRIRILNVLEPSSNGDESKARPGKRNPKLLAQLRQLVPSNVAERIGIEEEVVENFNPSEAIAQAAERFRADAICVGSRGRSGMTKTLLGSVAGAVMAMTKRPVFVVQAG